MASKSDRVGTTILVLFGNAQDVPVLCTALARKLQEAGFSVTDPRNDLAGNAERSYLLVSANRKMLEQEAEMSGMAKALLDGTMSKFSVSRAASFKNFDAEQERFFTESEEALLILHAIRGRVPNFLMFSEKLEAMVPMRSGTAPSIWRASPWIDWSDMHVHSKLTDAIVKYFGHGLGFYFQWLNHFTTWLCIPAAVGTCLSVSRYMRGITLDEDWSMPLYSIFIMLWSVVFIRCWERRTNYLCHSWSLSTDQAPQYAKASPSSYSERLGKYCVSILVTSVGLVIAFCVMICSLNLQGYIKDRYWTERPFYIPYLASFAEEGSVFGPQAGLIVSLVPTVLHASVILLLNNLYREVAEVLTTWENHSTEDDHHYSMVLKRFLFEAFDCYIALFYLAFAQFNIPALRSELISLYSTDQIRRVLLETILPACLNTVSQEIRFRESGKKKKAENHRDAQGKEPDGLAPLDLDLPEYESFDDFLEMVIEFGYVTLFASAFPLCPLVSLLCNIIEAKSDLYKVCFVYRRPAPRSATGIGAWLDLLKAISAASVITNCFLVSFSSEQIVAYLPGFFTTEATHVEEADAVLREGMGRYVVAICFLVEHLLGLVCLILYYSIPAESEQVRREKMRIQQRQNKRDRELLASLDSTAGNPRSGQQRPRRLDDGHVVTNSDSEED